MSERSERPFFVDHRYGSDKTGDGSIENPFATPEGAGKCQDAEDRRDFYDIVNGCEIGTWPKRMPKSTAWFLLAVAVFVVGSMCALAAHNPVLGVFVTVGLVVLLEIVFGGKPAEVQA